MKKKTYIVRGGNGLYFKSYKVMHSVFKKPGQGLYDDANWTPSIVSAKKFNNIVVAQRIARMYEGEVILMLP